ncbi:MAG TPA: hypothetical protein VFI59_04710 [Actinomycetota bacterium]|nr:hypothetical protein [Actinomycetota bacterium]
MVQGPGERARERDACGVGFVARADGTATTEVVALALEALRRCVTEAPWRPTAREPRHRGSGAP